MRVDPFTGRRSPIHPPHFLRWCWSRRPLGKQEFEEPFQRRHLNLANFRSVIRHPPVDLNDPPLPSAGGRTLGSLPRPGNRFRDVRSVRSHNPLKVRLSCNTPVQLITVREAAATTSCRLAGAGPRRTAASPRGAPRRDGCPRAVHDTTRTAADALGTGLEPNVDTRAAELGAHGGTPVRPGALRQAARNRRLIAGRQSASRCCR